MSVTAPKKGRQEISLLAVICFANHVEKTHASPNEPLIINPATLVLSLKLDCHLACHLGFLQCVHSAAWLHDTMITMS